MQGIFQLVEGKLSPSLLPFNVLQQTILQIQTILHTKYPGFHLGITSPREIQFLYQRESTKLYVTVKFPVSPYRKPLSLFKILSYPLPLNNTADHAT